jgi:DNA-binding response OmpR family regulator
MILQALLVSKDDRTAETLIQVLAEFGVAVDRSNAVDVASARIADERFDQVIVDFDDPETASQLLESCRLAGGPDRNPLVTVALLRSSRFKTPCVLPPPC